MKNCEYKINHFIFLALVFVAFALSACTSQKAELGSEKNPVKLYFIPSVDSKVLDANASVFKAYLESHTPYKFDVQIPASYVAVVEAFGTKKADVAALNSFGYILAHEKYGAEARMTVLRHGSSTYQSQFIVRSDSSLKSVKDLEGKKIAFVDSASASGYLLPMKTLNDQNVKPKEVMFAMRHDNVVIKVYMGEVDAGATYYSPPENGRIEDARRLVLTQYPDVEKKVRILSLSSAIPNDPVVFRKDMPEEMKTKIVNCFLEFVKTSEGKRAFDDVFGATDLKLATDQDYDSVRQILSSLGKQANEMIK